MSTDVIRLELPEEREIARLKAQVEVLEEELGSHELELASLQNQLGEFEGRYYRRVGAKYIELDELKAQFAELTATTVATEEAQTEATHARERANQAREEVEEKGADAGSSAFRPSKEIQNLFRSIVKKVHPDLGSDEPDRLYRTEFFKLINAAYREQDFGKLSDLARQWELRPESIAGEDTGAQLVRLLRKIAQVQSRTEAAKAELAALRQTELHILFAKEQELQKMDRDLLGEMCEDVERQIEEMRLDIQKEFGVG